MKQINRPITACRRLEFGVNTKQSITITVCMQLSKILQLSVLVNIHSKFKTTKISENPWRIIKTFSTVTSIFWQLKHVANVDSVMVHKFILFLQRIAIFRKYSMRRSSELLRDLSNSNTSVFRKLSMYILIAREKI